MRSCPKCGSYVPEGKVLCPACGRVCVGLTDDVRRNTRSEKRQTTVRFEANERQVRRDAPLTKRGNNPFAGGTYEQHKSHDPRSKDYYKSKHAGNVPESAKPIICAAAYFGFFFFIPLIALPNSKEAKFHANQGLALFLFGIVLSVVNSAASYLIDQTAALGIIFEIVNILQPLLMVYGAANAVQGKMTELPVIGKLQIIKDTNV